PLVALGGGAVVKIDRNGTVTSLTPGGFQAGGAARRGDDVLACGRRPLPPGERSAARAAGRDQTTAAPALLLPGTTGRATVLALGCPVSWAAAADVVAGAGGPQVAYRRTTRGASVLAGPHGGPLGLTVSLRAVTSFAVAVASAGAMYLRAAGESVLSDRLGSAPPSASGLGVAQRVAGKRDLRGLDATLRAAMPALPPLEVPVTQLETAEPTALGRPGSTQPARTRQTARLGQPVRPLPAPRRRARPLPRADLAGRPRRGGDLGAGSRQAAHGRRGRARRRGPRRERRRTAGEGDHGLPAHPGRPLVVGVANCWPMGRRT
ncbi:MAG TPA: hypothetical protein VEP73_00405, partial [Actinomycetota bacterium]|nr:hypothetical protein [Actinomycetota bacterium]